METLMLWTFKKNNLYPCIYPVLSTGCITIYTIETSIAIDFNKKVLLSEQNMTTIPTGPSKNHWHNIKTEKHFLTCFISTLLSKILLIKHIRYFETTLDPNFIVGPQKHWEYS